MAEATTVEVARSCDLSEAQREAVHQLFASNYREANHAYLDKSLGTLGSVALAECEGRYVGFAIADAVRADLPRFSEPQAIALAGLSCIDPTIRRQGLFKRLSIAAMTTNGVIDPRNRFLFAGRMAHLITYRTMASRASNAAPSPNLPLTTWQKEVGVAVARLFGSVIDPDTFVVQGPGRPIGYPKVEYAVPEVDAQLFAEVDRERGDSLLAMSWMPDAPQGWSDAP